jgi:hypothetical protein
MSKLVKPNIISLCENLDPSDLIDSSKISMQLAHFNGIIGGNRLLTIFLTPAKHRGSFPTCLGNVCN